MSRRPFLVGLLCGTIVTAVVAFTAQTLTNSGPAVFRSRAMPAAATIVSPGLHVVEQPDRPWQVLPDRSPLESRLPPGTHRYDINGQPVYVIPLQS
jgi:hypothetical protein